MRKICKRKCDPDNIKYSSVFNFKDIFHYLIQKQFNVLAMKSGSCKPIENHQLIDILDCRLVLHGHWGFEREAEIPVVVLSSVCVLALGFYSHLKDLKRWRGGKSERDHFFPSFSLWPRHPLTFSCTKIKMLLFSSQVLTFTPKGRP